MKPELVLDKKVVNDSSDCYVIAEIGNNHCGSVKICKDMIKAAFESGADAVKLQKRDNKAYLLKKNSIGLMTTLIATALLTENTVKRLSSILKNLSNAKSLLKNWELLFFLRPLISIVQTN